MYCHYKINFKVIFLFKKDEFKRYGDDGRVDRDHMMMALSNINLFMIRASYSNEQNSIRFKKRKRL
jgi:hypothetical protein